MLKILTYFRPPPLKNLSDRRDEAELSDVAEKTLAPVREKCSSSIESKTLQDPITVMEVGILWLAVGVLIFIVLVLGIMKYLPKKIDPNIPVDMTRKATLMTKINRNSLNFGLNRAGKHILDLRNVACLLWQAMWAFLIGKRHARIMSNYASFPVVFRWDGFEWQHQSEENFFSS